jgi:hypothetical protein
MALTNVRGRQILDGTVQYIDIQNLPANTILGNNTASATTIQEVSLANSNLLGRGATGNISAITAANGIEFAGTAIQTTASLRSLNGLTFASTSFVKMTGANTFALDTNTYLTGNQSITLSGAVTGSGATAITTTLANSVVGISNLSATGTPSSTTYLRGDNTWATIAAGGIGGSTGSTDNAILRADGTGGATLQNSTVTISDIATLTLGISTDGLGNKLLTVDGPTDIVLDIKSKGTSFLRLTSPGTSGEVSGGAQYWMYPGLSHSLMTRTSATSTPQAVANLLHRTTGTPAIGIGTGIGFTTQTSAGGDGASTKDGLVLYSVSTDITATTEDFDFRVDLVQNGANPAERLRVTSAGVLRPTGALDLSTSTSGQIIFPAAQNASAGANTLDDYEEGTWTPTLITDGTQMSSVTYSSNRSGSYTKIGNTVYITGVMQTTALTKGSGSGNALFGGLPFSTLGGASKRLIIAVGYAATWGSEPPEKGHSLLSGTSIALYRSRPSSTDNDALLTIADILAGAGNFCYFSGHYFI